MVIGIGTDIIEISRIGNAIMKEHFLHKYFTEKERALFGDKSAESAAANFAAKEAFSKALGTGIREFSLNEIEVLRDDWGAPYINLYGRAKKLAGDKGVHQVYVSLSHCNAYALAYVVLI